jgi:hypothetical protein
MRELVVVGIAALVAHAAGPAFAAGPVTRTFAAPVERVWTATETVLKHLGWDVDKADRSIGFLTTDSRRLDGDDFGVYAKGTRHRLQLVIKAAGTDRTTVSVERFVFTRERILWMDKDEPVATTDTAVETHVLDAIGKAL